MPPIVNFVFGFQVGSRSTPNQSPGQLVTSGFILLKKDLEKFNNHQGFLYQKNSSIKFSNFVKVMQGQILGIDKSVNLSKTAGVRKQKYN